MGKRLGDDLAKTTVSILSMIILSASTVFGAKSASSWSISGHGENLLPGKSDKGRRRDLMADGGYACGGNHLMAGHSMHTHWRAPGVPLWIVLWVVL